MTLTKWVFNSIVKAIGVLGASMAMFLLCLPAFSQGSAGHILGTITDANGGLIAGATVSVTDVDRGTSRVLTTDEAGAFNAPSLLPGNYKVRAEFKGFKATERQNLVLEVGQELRVDLTLQPGEQAQTITVTEELPLVETTNAELGGTIQSQVVNDLPLNGRNFENLLTLRPGVTIYPGGAGWNQSANGMRPHDNMYLVEGIDSNDPYTGQSVMNAVMAAGDAGTILPIDSINEFRTLENPRAEYGWKPGAVVNVGIKSGTNAFHGSAYAYGRNDSFDAVDAFTTRVPLSLEQYGAAIGGPIKKDKLFFFGNFESQQYSIASPFQHYVPDTSPTATDPTHSLAGACQATMDAGTVTALSEHLAGITQGPATSGHPNGTCVMGATPGLFPVSNGSNNLLTALTSTNTVYSGVGKIDYHINDKNSLSGMIFISPGSGAFVDDPGHQVAPRQLTDQYAKAIVGSVGWTYSPSSLWVNSFRFGYSHYSQSFLSADSNVNPISYGIYTGVTTPLSFGFPDLFIHSFSSLDLGASWPKLIGPDAVTNFADSISYLHGNHSIKFGGEFLLNQSTNLASNNTKGPMYFNTLQDYFTGTFLRARLATGNFVRDFSDKGFAAFVQDDWRITRRLTLNLGLRYEVNTVLTDSFNMIGNFSPTQGLEQVGVGRYNTPYNPDYNNFSPRLGFAWDVSGDGKTVVRGSAGILYEQGSFDMLTAIGNQYGLRTAPTGTPLYANGVQVPNIGGNINVGVVQYTGPALTGPNGLDAKWANNGPLTPLYSASPTCGDGTVTLPNGITPQPCTILGVDQNLRTPYISTWSLGIERALTNSLSLDVSYVGNHGTKMLGLSDLNAPPIGAGWTPAAKAGCLANYANCAPDPVAEVNARPYNAQYPYLSYIAWLSNNNMSNYNALDVTLTQRTSHGMSFVAGYTYSHALGESPDNWSFISPINQNPRSIYGSTDFDITHRFTFSATYEIPGIDAPAQLLKGWSLNTVVTLESGMPWSVSDLTTDFSGTNEISNGAGQPNNAEGGEQWDFFGNPADFKTSMALASTNGGLGGLPYFAGTSNATCMAKSTAMGALAVASLTNLGCYASLNGRSVLVPPAYGSLGTTSEGMFRGPAFYNVDFSITKLFTFGERFSGQFRAEVFNIFNQVNLANPAGGIGGAGTQLDPSALAGQSFGFQPSTPDAISSNPVLGSGGARAMQLGFKLMF